MLSENLAELNELSVGVLSAIHGASGDISMSVGVFDMQLPVALSGIGVLPYRDDGINRRALCFLAVIPEQTETKFIMGVAAKHASVLREYLQDESSPALIERVESWMCHGSDHWFMTPSAWRSISGPRREAICARILDTRPSIVEPVPFSVLDHPRSRIVAIAESGLSQGRIAPADVEHVNGVIAMEKAKLSWVGDERGVV